MTMIRRCLGMMSKMSSVVNRLAVVAVLAVMLGVAGVAGDVEAAQSTYYWQINNGTSLGGMSTNWSEACGAQPSNVSRVTTMTTATPGCATDRISALNQTTYDMVLMIKDTPYAQATAVTGVNVGSSLRERTTVADVQFTLGYVSGGTFTSFGSVPETRANTTTTAYTTDISGLNGVAPAGSYLALQTTLVNGDGSNEYRIYLGSGNSNSLNVTVDETVACSPDPAPTMNGGSFSGNPTDICAAVTAATNSITNYEVVGGGVAADDNFNDNTLDPKWSMKQVGNTSVAGIAETGGQLSLTNRGVDLWTVDDDYTFAQQGPFTGDFTVTTQVVSLSNSNAWAKAGVLIIDDDPTVTNRPKYAGMTTTPGNNFTLQTRRVDGSTAGADYGSVTGGATTGAGWVRLVRTGSTVEGFYSTNGTTWTSIGTDTVSFVGTVYVGLWTTSHDAAITTTAVFDNFTTSGLTTASTLYSGASCSGIPTTGWTNGTYNLNATYTDSCGATGNTTSGTFSFIADSTPPSAGTVTVTPDSGTYVPAAYTIATDFTDAESAVSSCEYTTDGTTWAAGTVSGTGPYTCSANVSGATGSQTINMRATSAGGGPAAAIALSRTVDATAPSTTATPAAGTYGADQSVSLNASDVSGVASTLYCIDTANTCTPTLTYSAAVAVTGTAGSSVTKYLRYSSTDNVGNVEATQSSAYIIDQTNAAPTLSVIAPAAGGATVTVGSLYSITYSLADPDNVVTAAFYYDTNADMVGGTAITGACATAAEGTSVTCSWDTTGMPLGNYYVYGTTTDGVNPAVSAVSPGQLTVTSPVTAAGSASATAGNTEINVSAPYTGDSNTNNTLLIEWGFNGVDFTLGSSARPHAASPYAYTIPSLTNGTAYQVRVTYQDSVTGDGVTGTAVQTFTNVTPLAWTDNGMLHNSARFDSPPKHNAAGGWGQPNMYGGGFTCATCHAKETGNVKRIKASISFPDGADMPGDNTVSATIDLQTVEDVSATYPAGSDFGDDSAGSRPSSNRICEACHTYDATGADGVQQHASDQAVAAGHYDNSDCIKCHLHNTGFKASCTTCHGGGTTGAGGTNYWPDASTTNTANDNPGRHLFHMEQLSQKVYGMTTAQLLDDTGAHAKQVDLCGYCHATPGADADHAVTLPAETSFANIWDKAADAGSAYVAGSCDSIACHNNQSTGSGTYGWNDAGTTSCTMCHTVGGANVDPTSGLHNVTPTVSGQRHDDSLAGGCAACHTDNANHRNGTTAAAQITFNASINYTAGATPTCGAGAVGCHDGAGDAGTWARKWSTTAANIDGSQCANCHGTFIDGWTWTEAAASTTDHTDPYAGNTGDQMSKHAVCTTCHGASYGDINYNTSWGGKHGDGLIEMNGPDATHGTAAGAEYNDTLGACAKSCHTTSEALNTNSGWTSSYGDYGAGDCRSCHDGIQGAAGSAYRVSVDSSHSTTITGFTCEQCHTAHESGDYIVPNNPAVGINYTGNSETGISLSDPVSAIPKITEAEICWACHDAQVPKVSEWGTNNNADGLTYDYGSMSTGNSSWYAGTWNSATFSYKNGAIQSTHSASAAGTATVSGSAYGMTETPDAVANIRCSYCHDVHDLNTLASDNSTGKPYLRGTWKGNPYNEDGAPRSGVTGSWATSDYGPVPRGSSSATNSTTKGGWWIDQNNANPNAINATTNDADRLAAANANSGLCALCHGDADGSWATGEIDTLDQVGSENLWVSGGNGHQNAVIGGSGTTSAANNIFSIRNRGSVYVADGNNNQPNAFLSMGAYTPEMNRRGFGYRGDSGEGAAGLVAPTAFNGQVEYWNALSFNWETSLFNTPALIMDDYSYSNQQTVSSTGGGTQTVVGPTTQNRYHTFNCGKCHNPHASRLPKLMITNCLDTKQNTWDDGFPTATFTNTSGTPWNGTTTSQWPTAQNCHRLTDDHTTTGRGAGWNTVTPW